MYTQLVLKELSDSDRIQWESLDISTKTVLSGAILYVCLLVMCFLSLSLSLSLC